MSSMRKFDTGATRNTDEGKLDFEGFLSPLVLERYGQYMHKHRMQADGNLRDSDNWQKGIPLAAYMKSGWRHFRDWWREHRGYPTDEGIEEALCALIFNASGYLHEHLKAQSVVIPPPPEYDPRDVAFSERDRITIRCGKKEYVSVNVAEINVGDVIAHHNLKRASTSDGTTAETAYLARFGENES